MCGQEQACDRTGNDDLSGKVRCIFAVCHEGLFFFHLVSEWLPLFSKVLLQKQANITVNVELLSCLVIAHPLCKDHDSPRG